MKTLRAWMRRLASQDEKSLLLALISAIHQVDPGIGTI
jgi:hypothetical protein